MTSLDNATSYFSAKTDACFHWIQSRDRARRSADPAMSDEAMLLALGNDVATCKVLRWGPFAFPSHPTRPLSPQYRNEQTDPADIPIKMVVPRARKDLDKEGVCLVHGTDDASWRQQRKKKKHKDTAPEKEKEKQRPSCLETEPSRYWLDAVCQRRDTPAVAEGGEAVDLRPSFGGYGAAAPSSGDRMRFVAFPQSHHRTRDTPTEAAVALDDGAQPRSWLSTPQEVPYFLRGTAQVDVNRDNPAVPPAGTDAGSSSSSARGQRLQQWWAQAVQLHLTYRAKPVSHRSASGDGASPARSSWLPSPLVGRSVTQADVFVHSPRVERRYLSAVSRVERRRLEESGARVTLGAADPRHGTRLALAHTTVPGSHRRKDRTGASGDDTVQSLLWQDSYEAPAQYRSLPWWWRRWVSAADMASYGLSWSAGPGVERCTAGEATSHTLFAKGEAEGWARLPLPRRFTLTLRGSGALVAPVPQSWPTLERRLDAEEGRDGDGRRPDEEAGVHEYFWATQGPRWNPKLLRGFADDYTAMHHARRWYALASLELKRGKKAFKEGRGADGAGHLLKHVGVAAFANACFVDSFAQYPRASVGLSLTSDIPRQTITAFNQIIPTSFECNFSWFVAFKEGELRSGLEPGSRRPADQQFLRLSPVETFHHMKCGLSWKL